MLQKFVDGVDRLNRWTAEALCWISVLLAATTGYEVICRYLLNSPTDWAAEINQYLLCAMSFLGGGYCLLTDQHVRVDFVFQGFTARRKAAVELATWWLAALFCAVLIWWGGDIALEALVKNKRSMSINEYPLYPSLLTIPLGALLLLLQIAARTIRNIRTLRYGRPAGSPGGAARS